MGLFTAGLLALGGARLYQRIKGADRDYSEKIADRDYARQLELQDRQFAYNTAEADKNRAWQEEMSNTSYQRAVEDMKKAGINPIMAIQQGGASTPSGASASGSSSSVPSSDIPSGASEDLIKLVGIFAGLFTAGAKTAKLQKK